MKIAWAASPGAAWMDPVIEALENKGCVVVKNPSTLDDTFDILFGATITVTREISNLHSSNPAIPMVNYNWDIYEWAYKDAGWRNRYSLDIYEQLLRRSKFIACPSMSVVHRNKDFFNIPEEQSVIVKSFARQITVDKASIRDDRFVYMPLRQIPDRNKGWFEKACDELKIPYKISGHSLSEQQYADTLASCSFIVCPWYEASTGGLSLIEGLCMGKPVLFSDSKYMGANDYMGEYGITFKHDSFEDFKAKIKDMWENPKTLDISQEYIDNQKPQAMADELFKVFKRCT